jgi:tRNA modification GTPase
VSVDRTIMACLTPPGPGAIATIGLRGRNALTLIAPLLCPAAPPGELASEQLLLGVFSDGVMSDRIVVTVDRAGPFEIVELHCHGGSGTVRWIMDCLCARGATAVSWETWLRERPGSHCSVAATCQLARALTARTAGILLDQHRGTLEFSIRRLVIDLDSGRTDAAKAQLERLAEYTRLGRHLTTPWKVVLAGPPNAGKSTLLNALVGHQRSITSPIAGTTRDALSAVTAFDGWPVQLIDTAGIDACATGLEGLATAKSLDALQGADLVLWILDVTAPSTPPPALDAIILNVHNKMDLLPEAKEGACAGTLRVSAQSGAGLRDLIATVARTLVPSPPPPGTPVPFDERTSSTVVRALEHLQHGDIQAARKVLDTLLS